MRYSTRIMMITLPTDNCQMCKEPFEDNGPLDSHRRRSWAFGVVCNGCSYHAGKVTQRQNKRCRKKGKAHHRLSRFEWLSVLHKHDFACAICKTNKEKLTLDHKVRLCDGGDNGWWNIQPLCNPCHVIKDGPSCDKD